MLNTHILLHRNTKEQNIYRITTTCLRGSNIRPQRQHTIEPLLELSDKEHHCYLDDLIFQNITSAAGFLYP